MGSSSGGTQVVVKLDDALAEGAVVYCKFGEVPVAAGSLFLDGNHPSITCGAPPGPSGTSVPLGVSVDGGKSYTYGSSFFFSDPVYMASVMPSGGSMQGGTNVTVTLARDPFMGESVGSGVVVPATCKFDDEVVMATYVAPTTVFCTAPPSDVGSVDLTVSVNGQDYSEIAAKFTYLFTSTVVGEYDANSPAYTQWFQTVPVGFYQFYGFYNDFYSVAELPPEPFYEIPVAQAFYFYEPFYQLDDIAAGPIAELCLSAYTPAVGPSSGGTKVTFKLAGTVPEDHQWFYCMFDKEVVHADAFFFTQDTNSPAFVCKAPPRGVKDKVTVKYSLNGKDWTDSGATFTYHDPISFASIVPSTTKSLSEAVKLTFSYNPFSSGGDAAVINKSAKCKFDDVEVAAEFIAPDTLKPYARVLCVAMAQDFGKSKARLSFDGQIFSEDSVDFEFLYEKDAVSKPAAEAVTETMTVPDGFYGFYRIYHACHRLYRVCR